ncbi:PTS system mannose/fructose/N-acetylgalactosamine-transporter subunit IIB [Oceanobacillus sojae]|uniref:PTS system mannose/fructose/N-acetylgalactosamine-transporter subunit IIB n=1 Tax=Oceanobacillus sojae TaxID=582851 RepID=UPI0009884E8B|nr:PTS sugar transporter subunit IIB [Oceanobacillus sojae]MCT1901935.1 PTS sugar transporter subunit IIB [Oceanobacillus sojae]
MSIAVTRIDERLIHGQVAYSWSVAYQVNEIVVVDDVLVNDEMQRMLLEMAVPEGKKFQLLSVDEASNYFKSENKLNTFLVVKGPQTILDLANQGVHFKEINVGGMYFKEGKEEVTKTVYLNDDEKKIFRDLASKNIYLDVRTAPSDKSIDLISRI